MAAQALSTPKILVVDDNAENRMLAQAALEDEGYEVVLCASGKEGILAFEAEAPDCVLLDVHMPDLDGFEVCARLRALPGGVETPILFLTASRDLETFDSALRAGGDDFLTKPVRPTELVVRVQSALKLRRVSEELREHYALVREQRDNLMRLQLQKERLMAFVVHDLKNPVNAIDLQAQLLLRDDELKERSRKAVKHIRDDARSLLRLILNLLDLSKSEEGRLVPKREAVDLERVVCEVVEGHELAAASARVTLASVVEARTLMADPDLLRRVLENLVDNAIRHAPEGSEVRLGTFQREFGVELRIADRGRGVAPELRAKIFEPFVQLDAREQGAERTSRGLGLAFCKLAVEAQGGAIWVEEGKPGAVFCVSLPHEP